ncbi:MAG: hypothetical protein HKP30_11795 [Myxococcales bacterium]|nr:hypothetical protein [Myxococcales bacterium]
MACVSTDSRPRAPLGIADADYRFFNRPAATDPWTARIGAWQLRQRAAARSDAAEPTASQPQVSAAPGAADDELARYETLGDHYDGFVSQRRQQLAAEVLDWIQGLARNRFIEDGPVDHWPTTSEVRKTFGDDCDGLELLAYQALLELGFPDDHVYRAIVMEPATGLHHMVTLWFETPGDPWVLDPTATITTRLVHLSELGGWVPLKLFSETDEFSVHDR